MKKAVLSKFIAICRSGAYFRGKCRRKKDEKICLYNVGSSACRIDAGQWARSDSDTSSLWTLKECIDYAMENNIDLQQSHNQYLSGIEDTKQAKAALFPSLSASTSQNYSNYPSSDVSDNNVYTGSYSLSARMSLFQGGSLGTAVKQQKVQNEIDRLSVEETANDIRTAIVQVYMQCLYASESVVVARSTADVSKAQRDRAEEMWKAGSISKVDFAQLESQWKSDEYQVVSAMTSLDDYKLQLKQLLELGIMDEMDLAEPVVNDGQILAVLPPKQERTRPNHISMNVSNLQTPTASLLTISAPDCLPTPHLHHTAVSTTAAFPVILCRCGTGR